RHGGGGNLFPGHRWFRAVFQEIRCRQVMDGTVIHPQADRIPIVEIVIDRAALGWTVLEPQAHVFAGTWGLGWRWALGSGRGCGLEIVRRPIGRGSIGRLALGDVL